MIRAMKQIPAFKDKQKERIFWESYDTTEYVNMISARNIHFPNLQKTKYESRHYLSCSFKSKV